MPARQYCQLQVQFRYSHRGTMSSQHAASVPRGPRQKAARSARATRGVQAADHATTAADVYAMYNGLSQASQFRCRTQAEGLVLCSLKGLAITLLVLLAATMYTETNSLQEYQGKVAIQHKEHLKGLAEHAARLRDEEEEKKQAATVQIDTLDKRQ